MAKLKKFQINYDVVSIRGKESSGSSIEEAKNKTEAKRNWLSRNSIDYIQFKDICEIK